MSFSRNADQLLSAWFEHPHRKPLVLRGARQVGKTTAVRRLADRAPDFLELNLERAEHLALIRSCRSAAELLERLQQRFDRRHLPANTLLFLDEIQEHPEAMAWLRFFREDHPQIAVIAAGSLLEVRLQETQLSYPVGRVEFLRLEPLTFFEFLRATGANRIAEDLEAAFGESEGVEAGLHDLAMENFRKFLLVGGMPEAVERWRSTQNLVEVRRVHDSLRQAYAEDLRKYEMRGGTRVLETVLSNAPACYGARFKVRNLGPGEKDRALTLALELLERAMVLHRVVPTASTTLPLVARPRAARKLLPLDIGLALSQLAVPPEHLAGTAVEGLLGGRIAEAFVGLQLLAAHPEKERSLSFWTREGKALSSAEVDYLVPTAQGVIPVEVKAGAAGSLKSLHRYLDFLRPKDFRRGPTEGLSGDASGDLPASETGVRLSASRGGLEELQVRLGEGRSLSYRLRSMPLYLAELLPSR